MENRVSSDFKKDKARKNYRNGVNSKPGTFPSVRSSKNWGKEKSKRSGEFQVQTCLKARPKTLRTCGVWHGCARTEGGSEAHKKAVGG